MTGRILRPFDSTILQAPYEDGADHVVPRGADQCAEDPRQPPSAVRSVEEAGDADIGNRADPADELEAQQTGPEPPAGQTAVAIGDRVVEDVIPGDGGAGCHRLRDDKARAKALTDSSAPTYGLQFRSGRPGRTAQSGRRGHRG